MKEIDDKITDLEEDDLRVLAACTGGDLVSPKKIEKMARKGSKVEKIKPKSKSSSKNYHRLSSIPENLILTQAKTETPIIPARIS